MSEKDVHDSPTLSMLKKMSKEQILEDLGREREKNKAACQSKFGLKPDPGKYFTFFTPKQLAELLQCSTKTLERWRKEGKGPKATKIGNKRIRYYIKDVDEFISQGRE